LQSLLDPPADDLVDDLDNGVVQAGDDGIPSEARVQARAKSPKRSLMVKGVEVRLDKLADILFLFVCMACILIAEFFQPGALPCNFPLLSTWPTRV
jgi:hypothetical protein